MSHVEIIRRLLRFVNSGVRPDGATLEEATAIVEAGEIPVASKLDVVIPASLRTEAFAVAWSEWQAHLREKKKTLTKRSASMQLELLANMGEARAVMAIRHSITMGWTGVFEPRGAGNERPNNGVGRHRVEVEGDYAQQYPDRRPREASAEADA